MMRKKSLIVVIAIIMILGMCTSAFANEQKITDESAVLDMGLVNQAYNEIKDQIVSDYQHLYRLDNFAYEFQARGDEGHKYVDINIHVDMTLTRDPADSPFVKGMEKAMEESTDHAERTMLQQEIDNYVSEINSLYYNIPNRSTFTYAISLDNVAHLRSANAAPAYEIYYRTDTADEVILIENEKLAEVGNPTAEFQEGYRALEDVKSTFKANQAALLASVSYDRLAARDWARDNYDADPEYPSDNVPGTDCANFVSKAINQGGIPQDKTGKWYQAATWGGWPGDHWFRTGYNGETGVVIYMTDKGYFYKESKESKVFAGSIMYWNNTSHVALVTYGDGTTIKYTQHGASQTKDTVYRSENASFYMPSSSIL